MNITVYLGANEGSDTSFRQAVEELGRWIGESGYALVYGGSKSGLMGALAGLLVSIALVWGLLRSTRKVALAPFFRWTGLLIIIIAAGLLSSAVNMLQAADIITFWTTQVFDISHILDDQGVFGTFLRALFGYNASPAGLQLLTWALYLAIFVTLWQRSYRPQGSVVPAKG